MPNGADWFFWALLGAVFAAATAIFAKVGVENVDPDYATFFRTVIILLVLGAIVWGTGKMTDPRKLPTKAVVFLTLSALGTGASWLCYFRALNLGDASRVAPVDKLSVALVAIFAVIFLRERPAATDWLAIGLMTAGAFLLAMRR